MSVRDCCGALVLIALAAAAVCCWVCARIAGVTRCP